MWWNSGPHLRRRMLVEAGLSDSYRTSQSFFSRCSAVDEFKDASWLKKTCNCEWTEEVLVCHRQMPSAMRMLLAGNWCTGFG